MLPREARKYLFDIRHACERLKHFTEGKELADYTADPLLRSAVERQFEIIGEALKQMLERHPDLADRITYHRRIIAFRNHLIHGYADVADDIVWGVLKGNLPLLHREVEDLLSGGEQG